LTDTGGTVLWAAVVPRDNEDDFSFLLLFPACDLHVLVTCFEEDAELVSDCGTITVKQYNN